MKIREKIVSTFQIDAIDADLGAFAFDARAGEFVDDASHSVHLPVDVAAIDPQASCI